MTIKKPLWFIKLIHYEYWVWWVFYLPLVPYYLWLAIKARSLTFFAYVNPGIPLGGLVGESKIDILKHIPDEYKPKTIYLEKGHAFEEAMGQMRKLGIDFPIVAKPDIGERGTYVEKIEGPLPLAMYMEKHRDIDILIQEYADYPIELGVFFYRMPQQPNGHVSSLCLKQFLTVTGNGVDSIETLLLQNERARFQIERLKKKDASKFMNIPPSGEVVMIEPIGNHCRGTAFLNVNQYKAPQLDKVFSAISTHVEGFYYGRFDMRVKSFEDLYEGKNMRILELNGISAEPAHIYDPQYSLIQAYKDVMHHWNMAMRIALYIPDASKASSLETIRLVQDHWKNKRLKA